MCDDEDFVLLYLFPHVETPVTVHKYCRNSHIYVSKSNILGKIVKLLSALIITTTGGNQSVGNSLMMSHPLLSHYTTASPSQRALTTYREILVPLP